MSRLPSWRLRAGLALLVACMAHACLALGWMLHALSRPEQLPAGPGHGLDVGLAQGATQPAVPSGEPQTSALNTTTLSAAERDNGLPESLPAEGTGGGGSEDGDDYLARVRAHLHRYRGLPEFAVLESGRVEVRFRVMPGGAVGAVELRRSAGRDALDQAALSLVMRAAPLPSPGDRALELVVPIEFR